MNRQNLQISRSAYPNQTFDAVLEAPTDQQLVVHSISTYNGSVGPNSMGVGHSLTTVAENQAGAASPLIGLTNNDFFTVQAKEKFGLVAFNISQASTGSPVYTYQYWNGAFVTLTLSATPDFASTGKKALVFSPPLDWVVDAEGFYAIKVTATTAPTQSVISAETKACNVIAYREDVLPKGELSVVFDDRKLLLQQGEEIIGFFAFPSSANTMETSYQISP